MSFNNLSISRKLALAFAAVVATIVAMSAVIFWNIAQLEKATQAEADANLAVDIITRAEFRLARQENSYRGFLLTNDPYYIERLDSHRATFNRHLEELRASKAGRGDEAEIGAGIADVTAKMDAWQREIVDEGRKLAADPIFRFKAVAMVGQNGKADGLMEPIEDALSALAEGERAAAAVAIEQRHSVTALTELVLYVGVGLAVLISAVLGWLLSRMIATPVNALTGVMGRLASGDNSVEVPAVLRGDEIGEMARAVLVFKEAAIEKIRLEVETNETRAAAESERARNEADKARDAAEDHAVVTALANGLSALAAGDLTYRIAEPFSSKAQKLKDDFNSTAAQLQDTMATIAEAIGGMRNGTGEISQAADDLSRRTEQQAASLEETAAALDEITATVKKTAEGAHQASEVTGAARVGAEKSGEVVRQAVKAMAQIEKSSQQIGQIIGVIDEIAFQTNLLALNAGVEAARAGEAGKGFAVVAQEVRALAQRSAEAAKEIKQLISTSTQQVEQGVDLVGQTGEALEKIVVQVGEITGLVSEIAASAREQSTGLAEVNSAVNQMDQVTQQNAAMVEQSTAASHNLAQEAEELAQLVAKFRLGMQPDAVQPALRRPSASAAPMQARPAAPALKSVSSGSGQAAALLAAQPADEGWEEF
ncbi:MAG: methyl-accepting chemotaxis protein [Aquamicrobium sp.]|uniref:methyl-accepting chemotaxis protein n=1 Tax=Aquamicrobium sp. TaxID=1872579 RepID=UPI00349E62A0|nr:methyl-accepting chemotaxis protein [Aquamicrobium sp.]